jgi:hypothetical protein
MVNSPSGPLSSDSICAPELASVRAASAWKRFITSVYLGDTGIYYRQISAEGEAAVTAGGPAEPPAGTLLYTF